MSKQVRIIQINEEDTQELLLQFAKTGKLFKFREMYLVLYPDAQENEIMRCMFFIRIACGLDGDVRTGNY